MALKSHFPKALKETSVHKYLKLNFSHSKEDGDFYYFKAKTPGFSYFAITGKQYAIITPVEKLVAATPSELKTEKPAEVVKNETVKGQASTAKNEKFPGFELILTGTCGLLGLACFKLK